MFNFGRSRKNEKITEMVQYLWNCVISVCNFKIKFLNFFASQTETTKLNHQHHRFFSPAANQIQEFHHHRLRRSIVTVIHRMLSPWNR